jgi:hypothetical protein
MVAGRRALRGQRAGQLDRQASIRTLCRRRRIRLFLEQAARS